MSLDLIYKGGHLAQDLPYLVNAPIGAIMIWSGAEDTVPEGWSICNGENGTLDLRDRFVLAAGDGHEVGDTGGSEEVTLTVEQMPRHGHSINLYDDSGTVAQYKYYITGQTGNTRYASYDTDKSGASAPHPNMPPYYTVLYIQKTGATPTDYVTEARVQEIVQAAMNGVMSSPIS